MSINNMYQLMMTNKNVIETILENCIKMLTNRHLLFAENLNDNIQKYKKTMDKYYDDMAFKITLDNKINGDNNIIIKIIQEKITSISKTSTIYDFLTQNKNTPILLIVKEITKKTARSITLLFPKTEVFLEEELMVNLVDHKLVPKHELLTPQEVALVFEKYGCKKRNFPKMFSTDPVARYYGMKEGDVCRILRPSKTSGVVVFYRLVVGGLINT